MTRITRREFIGQTAAAAAVVTSSGIVAAAPSQRSAIDRMTLGSTGIQSSRLGMGTGSRGGRIQRDLGQAGFEHLVRYAYDRGVRYFDTADSYQTHPLLKAALKGLPRDQLFLQTKIRPEKHAKKVRSCLDRFRSEMGVDYFDSVLIHCVKTADWAERLARMRDDLSTAKDQGVIRSHGMSCHGLQGLEAATRCDWIDIGLIRINPQGKHIDGADGQWDERGAIAKVLPCVRKLHQAGKGVIGMKIIGNGSFTDPADREKSIRFVMGLDCVDVIVIGFSGPQEVDEAIQRMDLALNA
jgi:predicted aldo/keto reductase-like oxidoreductase